MARFPMTAIEAFLPPDLRGDDASNVMDNLAASATPIAVEPAPRNIRQEQIDRLVAAGDDPRTAAMVVDRLREINGGEIPAGLFDSYNTPEGNAALAKRIAQGKAANARMDAFETNYNAETGHPEYGYDEAGNAAKLGRVNIDNPGAVERAGKRARAYNFNAPYNSEMESLNNPMSDERRAQIAADFDAAVAAKEAKWARAENDRLEQNKSEVEKYGHGNERQITKEQAAARYERKVAEDKMRQSPAVVEARLKRMAAAAGISMSEARALYNQGMEENGGGQTFDEFRRGTESLRDKATDRQLAAQQAAKDSWRATAMLAGGSQNINSGNRAIYNQAAQIEDPVKRAEFLAQFRQTPGNYQSNDPRIQVAQIQAQAQKDNAAAEREARNSQNQWLAQHQAGIEERASAARMHDAAMQRQFDAEQRQVDREHAASQGNAAREEAAAARQAELDQRRLEHEEKMAAEERRYQLMREENAAREKAAEQRHTETLEGMRSDREARTSAAGATVEAARIGADARRGEAADARAEEARRRSEVERAQTLGGMVAKYGDGVNHIAAGNYETPEADAALRKIAEGSDQSWFWGGFLKADGERMNAALKLLGVPDPAIRRRLVEKYGFQMQSHGGRNDRGGYYFHGNPEY